MFPEPPGQTKGLKRDGKVVNIFSCSSNLSEQTFLLSKTVLTLIFYQRVVYHPLRCPKILDFKSVIFWRILSE